LGRVALRSLPVATLSLLAAGGLDICGQEEPTVSIPSDTSLWSPGLDKRVDGVVGQGGSQG
jgi:hypothetical protein